MMYRFVNAAHAARVHACVRFCEQVDVIIQIYSCILRQYLFSTDTPHPPQPKMDLVFLWYFLSFLFDSEMLAFEGDIFEDISSQEGARLCTFCFLTSLIRQWLCTAISKARKCHSYEMPIHILTSRGRFVAWTGKKKENIRLL